MFSLKSCFLNLVGFSSCEQLAFCSGYHVCDFSVLLSKQILTTGSLDDLPLLNNAGGIGQRTDRWGEEGWKAGANTPHNQDDSHTVVDIIDQAVARVFSASPSKFPGGG